MLFNWINLDNMVIFKAKHEIHLSTFHLFFPTLSSSKSLVVGINASIGLLEYLFY